MIIGTTAARLCSSGLAIALLLLTLSSCSAADDTSSDSVKHPKLILTKAGVERIRSELGSVPLFDATLARVKADVDAEIEQGIDTPVPKDFSGGYTHERHKRNFFVAQQAGALFQILDDEKYAVYVRDMLFQYEAMYKDLPLHPAERSYARGKLFWQCLNDANWLVYMSQAYDAIYAWLSEEERATLEDNLFRPFADHISVDSRQFFNRVHNHSTWGSAAVGMIGLVMGDDELVERALYGIQDDGLAAGIKDDDGGFIREAGQEAGFFANLAEPFSPDGYYTEGPYYQRYAMYPFLIFAQGMNNVAPEHEVLQYKDGVLLKAVDALLQLTDADGEFFPLNDGQKGMSYQARELVTAVDMAYHAGEQDPRLLSIAEEQGQVLLDDAGFSVALAVRDGKTQLFEKKSVNLRDGPEGDQGGVGVLRYGDESLTLVFKYAAQGLSHGHYDKLSMSLYERGAEVLQDYGLARFVNIGQKGGGNYLPENSSWAKQTIAHNTVTQNEGSHFGGEYEVGSQHHSELYFYDDAREDVKVVSATETNAYPGTEMRRTMALIKNDALDKPFLLDLFQIASSRKNQYDLPFYYFGQIISTNFEYASPSVLQALGDSNGYQHLYLEGRGKPSSDIAKMSWMDSGRFYTLTALSGPTDELLFARLGANDPDFNLRRDPAFILRRSDSASTVFATTIETHGSYSPVTELALNSNSSIAGLKMLLDDAAYTALSIEDVSGNESVFILSNADASAAVTHELEIADSRYTWTGPYYYGAR
ncbi:MAG: alginate lyase family protein [Pseudomonadota bacterium]